MILKTLLANKHTTGSALAFAMVKAGSRIASIWFPSHKDQIENTADVLESLAVLYLGFSAGDATQSQKQVDDLKERTAMAVETHNTEILKMDNQK